MLLFSRLDRALLRGRRRHKEVAAIPRTRRYTRHSSRKTPSSRHYFAGKPLVFLPRTRSPQGGPVKRAEFSGLQGIIFAPQVLTNLCREAKVRSEGPAAAEAVAERGAGGVRRVEGQAIQQLAADTASLISWHIIDGNRFRSVCIGGIMKSLNIQVLKVNSVVRLMS